MIKNKLLKICLIIFIFSVSVLLFLKFNTSKKIETKTNTEDTTKKEEPKIISCTRTTRLENEPYFDRALSLIEETYKRQENNSKNYGLTYFFPSQLTNCIKVIEGEVRETNDAEGYFIFNSDEIKDNYFPIYIDKDYSYSDEIINSLLLVHEITHVQQYLDSLNNKEELSCIDKEVKAFAAQFQFYYYQSGEYKKSVDFRIENDKYLNIQLQFIKIVDEERYKSQKFGRIRYIDVTEEIKKIIYEDYKKQCDL